MKEGESVREREGKGWVNRERQEGGEVGERERKRERVKTYK